LLDGRHVETDRDLLVVAADHGELDAVALVGVELLVRHEGREVDEVAGVHVGREFEPLSPVDLKPARDDIDGDLVTAVMVDAALRESGKVCRPTAPEKSKTVARPVPDRSRMISSSDEPLTTVTPARHFPRSSIIGPPYRES
jgi:hypothetical protein